MGIRGELFSTKVALQNRTYFFNVKENRLGDLYLNIVESKNRDEGGFERQSVILFAEDLQEFLQGFDESLHVLERAVREKRRGPPPGKRERPQSRDRRPDEEQDRPDREFRGGSRGDSPGDFPSENKGRKFYEGLQSGGPRGRKPGKRSEGVKARGSYRSSDRPSNSRADSRIRGLSNRPDRPANRPDRRSDTRPRSEREEYRGKKDASPRKKRVVVKKR